LKNRNRRTRSAKNRVPAWLGFVLEFKTIGIIAALGGLGLATLLLAHSARHPTSFFSTEGIVGIGVLFAGAVPGLLSYRKIRQRRSAPREVLFLGDEDSVAEVAELQGLLEKADAALSLTRRKEGWLAVLLLDLYQFQKVNDQFGRGVGDEVLRAFARRLKSVLRTEDTVAHLGGDEFVILQVGSAQPSGARSLAVRLMKSLLEPYQIGSLQVTCGARIGVAVAPTDGGEWETLLSCADTARLRAKAEDNCTVCFFEAGMDAAFRKRHKLEAEMRRALETEVFQLAFQPLFGLKCGKLMGFETLLRWPAGWEQQSPAVFIPIAEESGLIVPIGAWVLETACSWAAAWTKPLKVSVNVSPVQFRHGDIVALVEQALSKSGLDPARLELEVTESLWLQATDGVLNQLTRLRAMGITIALDDFGTGSSGLSCLCKFPFDAVKIDRSFVAAMSSDTKSEAMVKSIVALGKTLHLTVTAEGVETRAQADALIAAGCDRVQGYLYGRPLSATSPVF
jgi:diguanylate cyclase (GGDEF)-like protein